MTESLHKIVMHYLPHSEADDLCQDITGWLKRNYQHYKDQPLIDKIREDIWKSCDEADKAPSNKKLNTKNTSKKK